MLGSRCTLFIMYDGRTKPLPEDAQLNRAELGSGRVRSLDYGITYYFEGKGFPQFTPINENDGSLLMLKNAMQTLSGNREKSCKYTITLKEENDEGGYTASLDYIRDCSPFSDVRRRVTL